MKYNNKRKQKERRCCQKYQLCIVGNIEKKLEYVSNRCIEHSAHGNEDAVLFNFKII